MSGGGGGKPGVRTFWDYDKNTVINASDFTDNSYESALNRLTEHIGRLEKRIEQLETTYMEEKLLGKTE